MGTIYEYKILWATIYTSTRACGHNGGCGMCLTVPCSLSLVTWNTAPDHSALCGNVRVPAQQSAAWLLLGAAGQRSNPSVCCRLPGAVFHLSTPVRPSWCSPNHPQSLQMLQLWNQQIHLLQSLSNENNHNLKLSQTWYLLDQFVRNGKLYPCNPKWWNT